MPPYKGTFEVIPKEGNATSTFFNLVTGGWIDADTPLTYKFIYYLSPDDQYLEIFGGNNPMANTGNILKDYDSKGSMSVILPTPKPSYYYIKETRLCANKSLFNATENTTNYFVDYKFCVTANSTNGTNTTVTVIPINYKYNYTTISKY